MSHDRILEEIVTKFMLHSCWLRQTVNTDEVHACLRCVLVAGEKHCGGDDVVVEYSDIPVVTGSVAEFYIEPMLSCVGDVDVMYHRSNQLAIPAGYALPTQLPGEFGSRVELYEIVNSEFPGYVYLWLSYLLTEPVDDGKYEAMQCKRSIAVNGSSDAGTESTNRHGPALVEHQMVFSTALAASDIGLCSSTPLRLVDNVFCIRCLSWPPQAADWPTRHRNYSWPDSATVDRVVSSGCDVVGVAHPLCRQHEIIGKSQWRLSFSRAEIVLLNSWMPAQQIVYHMLRAFVKTERLTYNSSNSGAGTLSNYHIKTLMLWASELKSRSWWTDDLNLVRICVELLHILAAWLTDAYCPHYFINNCNLLDRFENSLYTQDTENRLKSISRQLFCKWCVYSYIHQCGELCPRSVSNLLQDVSFGMPHDGLYHICLQNAVSAIAKSRLDRSLKLTFINLSADQCRILCVLSSCSPKLFEKIFDSESVRMVVKNSLTLQSCLCWVDQLAADNQLYISFFISVVFLQGACKTMQNLLTDELLDVLATACLQSNNARRCLNARHSSVLSLSQAATLMTVVVANVSHSTVQLIEIELAKAYLHRALRLEDSHSASIYCLANIYLAVLYHTTGHYQATIDHCKCVVMSRDHSQCRSHFVQGELLPRIDDQVDNSLGLAVLYQHIRAAVLNKKQVIVSVFTTEWFAHYLHAKFLSVTKYHQLPQTLLADDSQHYQQLFRYSPTIFVTDLMLFRLAHGTKCLPLDPPPTDDSSETTHQLNTCRLVQLLQQSAVEHLTTCHELEIRDFGFFVTPEFKALYAYKCGEYRLSLQLSVRTIRSMITAFKYQFLAFIPAVPEFILLMDDDIVSLLGLKMLIKSDFFLVIISQLSLSLYLVTQCQLKLRHSVTSLATILDYVQLARSSIGPTLKYMSDCHRLDARHAHVLLDQHLLKFLEQ